MMICSDFVYFSDCLPHFCLYIFCVATLFVTHFISSVKMKWHHLFSSSVSELLLQLEECSRNAPTIGLVSVFSCRRSWRFTGMPAALEQENVGAALKMSGKGCIFATAPYSVWLLHWFSARTHEGDWWQFSLYSVFPTEIFLSEKCHLVRDAMS